MEPAHHSRLFSKSRSGVMSECLCWRKHSSEVPLSKVYTRNIASSGQLSASSSSHSELRMPPPSYGTNFTIMSTSIQMTNVRKHFENDSAKHYQSTSTNYFFLKNRSESTQTKPRLIRRLTDWLCLPLRLFFVFFFLQQHIRSVVFVVSISSHR